MTSPSSASAGSYGEPDGVFAKASQTFFLLCSIGVTLYGVSVLGWSLRTVILLYWVENIIIGIWQVMKMLSTKRGVGTPLYLSLAGKLFLVLFFSFHYGAFCAVHGLFILVLTSGGQGMDQIAEMMKGSMEPFGPWIFVSLLWSVLQQGFAVMPQAVLWSVAAMFLARGLETWRTFFANGEWKSRSGTELMSEPYRHIIVIHIALIFCGALGMMLGNALPLLLGIVIGKAGIDLREIWGKPRPAKTSPLSPSAPSERE